MSKVNLTNRTSLMIAGLALAGAVMAVEQPTEITITATGETKVVVGRSAYGTPIEEVTLTRRVSYADLDLSKTAGAAELEKRVNQTAKDACKELDARYPFEPKAADECMRSATKKAMDQVHAVVTKATK